MRIDTWNVQCQTYRTGGLRKLTAELMKARLDVVAIQESGYNKDAQNTRFGGYNIFHSSNRREHVLGTAFLVARRIEHLVLDFQKVSERMCVLRIKGRFKNYSIINVHAPHNEAPESDKDAYYELLGKTYDERPAHDIKIVIGDFNAKVGKEEVYRPTIGKYSLHDDTNENGQRMIFYAAERDLVVKSTFHRHRSRHLATWEHPNTSIPPSQIDHCLISGRHFSDVIDVKTRWMANVDSDHYLVAVTVRAHIARVHNGQRDTTKRYAVQKLNDPLVAETFAQNISTRLRQLHDAQLGSRTPDWHSVCEAVKQEANTTIGYQSPNDRNTWFDAECAELTARKNAARIEKLTRRTRRAADKYKELRRQEKRLHRRKKRELQDRTLLELERLQCTNETRKIYKQINCQRKGYNPQLSMCRATDVALLTGKQDVLGCFKERFNALLNGETHGANEDEFSFLNDDGRQVDVPTLEEVKKPYLH